jgi:hypothetical protein
MLRFTIRDVLWLSVVVALAVAWQLTRRASEIRAADMQRQNIALQRERDTLFAKLRTTANKEEIARAEAQTWEGLYNKSAFEASYFRNTRSTPSNRQD